jgi:hypothetical protein
MSVPSMSADFHQTNNLFLFPPLSMLISLSGESLERPMISGREIEFPQALGLHNYLNKFDFMIIL